MAEETENKLVELQERARTEFGIVNADQMSEQQLKAEIKALEGQPDTAETAEPDTATPEPSEGEDQDEGEDQSAEDLSGLNRAELQARAEEVGVEDPSSYSTKADLIKAIEEAKQNA